ncbi:MAG TPA: VWA domain-containing protein [Vicinamibacterales bacterium]|nr:VWA domain-containing protein [Vicinamibacterales bacterium]
MVRRLVCVGILAAAFAGPPPAAQPVFRSGAPVVVPVPVIVTDAGGRLVTDLDVGDFELRDDGRPQRITHFDNSIRPISLVVLVDTSLSMTLVLDRAKAAVEQLLLRLLPDDRALVGGFAGRIELDGEFTSDRDALLARVRELDYGSQTRLYDAVAAGVERLRGEAGGMSTRRVVLVVTDGADMGSQLDADEVLARAQRENVMIYGVGLETEITVLNRRVRSRPDRTLRRFAEATGGGWFQLDEDADLGPTFTRVARELHTHYLLGFTPERLDNREHRLEVKIRRPGLVARARRSYIASVAPDSTGSPAAARNR